MILGMEPGGTPDLGAYCARIGHRGSAAPTLETLEALCLQHAGAIPFENLDPLAGLPVRLDLASLEAKLVRSRRGGYCFEHNLLFAAVLRALGFQVTLREARVRFRVPPDAVTPRTHGTLQVEAGGRSWLVDVGFGADGLLGPVPMDGEETERYGEGWRLLAGQRERLLQARVDGTWKDYYLLLPGPVFPVDWVVANHYTCSHPDSRFVKILTVQTSAPGLRRALRGHTLTETREGRTVAREVAPEEVPTLIRDAFGLVVPDGHFALFPKYYDDNG